jgi:thiamine biosynthesis lipoprotein
VTDAYVRTTTSMGTVVTAHVVGQSRQGLDRESCTVRALEWFERVERTCSRFNPDSELTRLTSHVGEPLHVSDILFETLRFAIAAAEESGGAFDPTVGHTLAAAGFDREHRTGRRIASPVADEFGDYRDVELDEHEKTVMLAKQVMLDLGGVAKGFAVDLAARELRTDGFENFVIDAGGDLYLAGHNANDEPWSVGIRHPRDATEIIETLRLSDVGVCTSGDYERIAPNQNADVAHHIVDPRTRRSASDVSSVTVIAPGTMTADALSTAAFVLGPTDGIALLRRQKVRGFLYTTSLERYSTDS